MRRGTAVGLLLVGTIVVGAAAHQHITKYSNERIWGRQRPLIEKVCRSNPEKQAKFGELRGMLDGLEGASNEQKCKAELKFVAMLDTKGDEEKAEKLIASKTYEPYAGCKPTAQLEHTATKWYSIAGLAAIVLGAIGLIRSRKD